MLRNHRWNKLSGHSSCTSVALTSGYSPNGNNFENALATELANLITPKRKAMTF